VQCDRRIEQGAECRGRLIEVRRQRAGRRQGIPPARPCKAIGRGPPGFDPQAHAGAQLQDAGEHRLGGVVADAGTQKVVDAGEVHAGRQPRQIMQLLDFRGHCKAAGQRHVVQWLDAEPVAGDEQ
jgi:hypothetical protein